MSYNLRVRVEGGRVSIANDSNLPDGEFDVGGHEDGDGASIAVVRRTPDGRYAAGASHHHPKES